MGSARRRALRLWPRQQLAGGLKAGRSNKEKRAVGSVARSCRPRLAVAPDVNDYTNFEDALAWADELSLYADTVIVVPKAVHPTDVPDYYRVGMPCQERFGPPPWKWLEYRPCKEVHFLGGSPVKHREIVKYGVPMESLDTSVPLTSAGWGDFWNGRKWENTSKQEDFFYENLERSYRNLRVGFNQDRRLPQVRCRNRRVREDREWEALSEDADLWGPGEVPPAYYGRYG